MAPRKRPNGKVELTHKVSQCLRNPEGQETTEENEGRSQVVGEEALLHEIEPKQIKQTNGSKKGLIMRQD